MLWVLPAAVVRVSWGAWAATEGAKCVAFVVVWRGWWDLPCCQLERTEVCSKSIFLEVSLLAIKGWKHC